MENKTLFGLMNDIIELKQVELKYKFLIDFIKNEAKEIYFDKDKVLKLIDFLNNEKTEKIEERNNENE